MKKKSWKTYNPWMKENCPVTCGYCTKGMIEKCIRSEMNFTRFAADSNIPLLIDDYNSY